MSDRLKPYALVVVDRCGYRVAHHTWGSDCDGRPTGATVVMVRKGDSHD